MLTLWGGEDVFCGGLPRRSFLRIGAFGGTLTLADLLRARGDNATSSPPKAAIMVYLPGGPPHLDTYDPKPDAPSEFRGEFQSIQSNVPGVRVCEHLPLQARIFDKLAVIRSIVTVEEHSDSLVNTGYGFLANRTARHPSFGAVVSRLRGQGGVIPPFVSLRGMTVGLEPGYLGVAHRAFTPSGPAYENLRLPNGTTQRQVDQRRDLLVEFDNVRRDLDATGTMSGMDAFQQRAFDMVAS